MMKALLCTPALLSEDIMFKPSKTLLKHPKVSHIVSGAEQGSDYKMWVFLKVDCSFQNDIWAGCTGGAGFQSVAEALYALGEYHVS